MTLEEFATQCGCVIHECSPDWGGKYGYSTKDYSTIRMNGFKTKNAAYKDWMENTFGKEPTKIVLKLLKEKK